jgi:hypothetical protein
VTGVERARFAWTMRELELVVLSLRGRRSGSREWRAAYEVADRMRRTLRLVFDASPRARDLPALHTMHPGHKRWREFTRAMLNDEGTRLRRPCLHDHRQSKRALRAMGFDVPTSLARFVELGGYCDCEVMLNTARRGPRRKERR